MAEQTAERGIDRAINSIKASLPAFGKDRTAGDGGFTYKFRSIEDMMPTIKDLQVEHGVNVYPLHRIQSDSTDVTHRNNYETLWRRVITESAFRFVSVEDGSERLVQTVGEGRDSSDKACNKAMTAALKYAYIEVYDIGGEDPDAERFDAVSERQPAPSQRQQEQPVDRMPPSMIALRDLRPQLEDAGLYRAVKAWAANEGIDMTPGARPTEDEAAKVLAHARAKLAQHTPPAEADQPAVLPDPPDDNDHDDGPPEEHPEHPNEGHEEGPL